MIEPPAPRVGLVVADTLLSTEEIARTAYTAERTWKAKQGWATTPSWDELTERERTRHINRVVVASASLALGAKDAGEKAFAQCVLALRTVMG